MKLVNIFDKNGITLQQIVEKFLIDYCLGTGIFNK